MPYGAFGLRRLLDSLQTFGSAGLPVYLRTKNFTGNPLIEETGMVFVPTASGALTGTSDSQIYPPPDVKVLSFKSVADAISSGVALRSGALRIKISHTWVASQQNQKGYATPLQVFTDASVIGIVTDASLLTIENITHADAFGQIIEWNLDCNSLELSGA